MRITELFSEELYQHEKPRCKSEIPKEIWLYKKVKFQIL